MKKAFVKTKLIGTAIPPLEVVTQEGMVFGNSHAGG